MGWDTLRLAVLEPLNSAVKEGVQVKSYKMQAVTRKFLWMKSNNNENPQTSATTKPSPQTGQSRIPCYPKAIGGRASLFRVWKRQLS